MVNYRQLDAIFSALADPTRRRMIERLARGAMSVGEMSQGFALSQPGISKHVKVLERAGLLKREIVGRVHRCKLEPKAIETAGAWVDRQRRFWNAALDRLDAYLERESAKSKKGR